MKRRASRVLLTLSIIAAMAFGLTGCGLFGDEEVSKQEVKTAFATFNTVTKTVEEACTAKREGSKSLPAARRSYIIAVKKYEAAKDETYDFRDETESLPDTLGTLEEETQFICPGTFEVPKTDEQE